MGISHHIKSQHLPLISNIRPLPHARLYPIHLRQRPVARLLLLAVGHVEKSPVLDGALDDDRGALLAERLEQLQHSRYVRAFAGIRDPLRGAEPAEEEAEDEAVFYSHGGALRLVGQRGVGGVADEDDIALGPGAELLVVAELPLQDGRDAGYYFCEAGRQPGQWRLREIARERRSVHAHIGSQPS